MNILSHDNWSGQKWIYLALLPLVYNCLEAFTIVHN
jgi:hypothetical protein